MSHVATIDLHITDLYALEVACLALGLEFVAGQKTFRWYGVRVGDYPLPEAFPAADRGTCGQAVRLPDNENAYDVGGARRRAGNPG